MLKNKLNVRNLSLNVDKYELSMMQTYWAKHMQNRHAVFEMYFRKNPFKNGYAIFAGLQHMIQYIQGLHFSDADVQFLKNAKSVDGRHMFDPKFCDYLKNFKFHGTIRAPYEGDLVFPNEPIVQVEGNLLECQFVETTVLNMINYSTLIATKASRVKTAAGNRPVMEFGTRRAQEIDAGLWGTRAAYIGGADGTSNVLASQVFGIPMSGTFAHALVESFPTEYDAFKAYAESHYHCTFLVDTYNTIKSGVPDAIKVANEMGDKIHFDAVRLDSGDMAYLSKQVRSMLDKAGYKNTKIVSSDGLDEHIIDNLKAQKARIDAFGVGTKLITAYDQPSLGGVYKLVSIEQNGKMRNAMKLTGNPAKMTTPGKKQAWRIIRKSDGKSEGDYITLAREKNPNELSKLHMFHPTYTYIHKDLTDFKATPLLKTIFKDGKLVYHTPGIKSIKKHAQNQLSSLWSEYKRLLNPQPYPVDLSKACWTNKQNKVHQINKYIDNLK